MGTTSYQTTLNTRDAIREYANDVLGDGYDIVAHSIVSTGDGRYSWSTIGYYAIRNPAGDVFACLFLASKRQGEFFVKIVDETMGPGESHGITEKVLNALTPTTHEIANEWRASCWRVINRRKIGKRILHELAEQGGEVDLSRPVNYSNAGEVTRVWIAPGGAWYTTDRLHRLRPPAQAWDLITVEADAAA